MSLKIGKKIIKCKVNFLADGDMGEDIQTSFVISYKRPSFKDSKDFNSLNFKKIEALNDIASKDSKAPAVQQGEKLISIEQEMSDFVRERVTGWDDIFGVDGELLAFNDENFDLLFQDREVRHAIFDRYQELVSFRKKDEEKNSKQQEKDGS